MYVYVCVLYIDWDVYQLSYSFVEFHIGIVGGEIDQWVKVLAMQVCKHGYVKAGRMSACHFSVSMRIIFGSVWTGTLHTQ